MLTVYTRWEARSAALRFWCMNYQSGSRIVYDPTLHAFFVHRTLWTPRLRVEEARGFNVFRVNSTCNELSIDFCRQLKIHASALIEIFRLPPPANLAQKFFHLLSKDHELYPLITDCEAQGYKVNSIPLDGGHLPYIDGELPVIVVNGERQLHRDNMKVPPSEAKQPKIVPLLADYLRS